MATPNEIELAESEVARLIEVMHRQGLNYFEILGIFETASLNLYLQAGIEYRIKGGE